MDKVRELMAKRAALLTKADAILKAAVDEGRPTTDDENSQVDAAMKEAADLQATIQRVTQTSELMASLDRTEEPQHADPNHERGYAAQRARDELRATAIFVREGNIGPLMEMRAASNDTEMNITTAADGGVTVPTGHYAGIIAKRNEGALYLPLGVMPVPGLGTTVDVPYETAGANEFVNVGDEYTTDNDRDAPALNKVSMTLVDFTKDIELTNDLMSDTDANLMAYLDTYVGRALALTHNHALVTEALANGTAVAMGAAAAATAGDPETLEFALASEYGDGAAYVMARATHGKYAKLTGNPFLYQNTPTGNRQFNGGPVYYSSYVPAVGAGNKSLIYGNFGYMGLRQGTLAFLRNPYLLAKKRKVVLHYYARIVYKVLNADAILYGQNPTA